MTYGDWCPTPFVGKPISSPRSKWELPVTDCFGMEVVTPDGRRVPSLAEPWPKEATRHCDPAAAWLLPLEPDVTPWPMTEAPEEWPAVEWKERVAPVPAFAWKLLGLEGENPEGIPPPDGCALPPEGRTCVELPAPAAAGPRLGPSSCQIPPCWAPAPETPSSRTPRGASARSLAPDWSGCAYS